MDVDGSTNLRRLRGRGSRILGILQLSRLAKALQRRVIPPHRQMLRPTGGSIGAVSAGGSLCFSTPSSDAICDKIVSVDEIITMRNWWCQFLSQFPKCERLAHFLVLASDSEANLAALAQLLLLVFHFLNVNGDITSVDLRNCYHLTVHC